MRLFAILLVLSTLACVLAQFGGMPGQVKGPTAHAVKSDIKYIRCEVCQHVAKNAYRLANAYKKEVSQREKKHERKFKEIDLLEKIEKLTNPMKDEGEWIAKLDLVESGDKLLVKEQEGPGKCGTECKTVQKAAEDVIEDLDTDIAEKLWQGSMSRSQFTNWLCQEASTACKGKPPKVPSSRKPGPAFEPVDPEELKMQKMMATMQEMGMGGQVYDRQQAQKFAQGAKEDDFDDDDYDDEDDEVSGPVGGKRPGLDLSNIDLDKVERTPLVSAKDTVNSALNTAKDLGSGLLDKASSWIGGTQKTSEAEL